LQLPPEEFVKGVVDVGEHPEDEDEDHYSDES
jgi:hypothetical protein